jgi:chemotaxis protein MotB
MTRLRTLIVLAALLSTVGCVSSGKYQERLTDIDNLKQNVSSLYETLRQKEAELAKLNKEHEDLKKKSQALSEDNKNLNDILKAKKDELNKIIAELRAKLANREVDIFSLQKRVDELSQEKAEAIAEKEKSIADLKKTYDSMVGAMQEEIQKGEVTITQLKDKLTLSMVEKILFDSGSAKIKKNGEKVLDRVVEVLKKVTDKQIRIEGYTDNVPIGAALVEKFPTNWELSTARATNVVRYLQQDGIDPQLLGACGYSEYRPIASNDTEEGKAKNRRIEVVLTPKDFVKVPAGEKNPSLHPAAGK